MGDKEATRVCGCCQKEVAEANFALHESHCRRFLVLCPDCDENVPRSELEAHREEQHSRVRCPKCQKKMEKRLLAEHEKQECPARLELCVFCDLEKPWSELQEHAVACGSRTELCPDCGRYVKLSDRDEHNSTCSDQDLYNDEPRPTRRAYGPRKSAPRKIKVLCKTCMMMIPAEEIKKHEMRCTTAPRWNEEESDSDSDDGEFDFLSPRLRNMFQDLPQEQPQDLPQEQPQEQPHNKTNQGMSQDQTKDPYKLSTCPHCQLLLPHTTLLWHERKCKLHKHLKHGEDALINLV